MSRYDWEEGTLLLPTSEVAPLKKVLRAKQNELHEAAYQGAREWLRKNGAKYRRAISKSPHGFYSLSFIDPSADSLSEDVTHTIFAGKGKMPTREQVHPPKVTSKTNVFCFDEAVISFVGRSVTYSSGENNRQQERAREHPISQAFFSHLGRIKWTRGSGGVLVGNDEYNRDDTYAGGGANYITGHYGPRGCQEVKRVQGFDCACKLPPSRPVYAGASYGYGRRW